jgi:hypothetical protein
MARIVVLQLCLVGLDWKCGFVVDGLLSCRDSGSIQHGGGDLQVYIGPDRSDTDDVADDLLCTM